MRRVVRQWKPCLREPSGNPTSRPSLRAEARRAGGVEAVAAAPSLHRRIMKAPSPIPTGLHHPAQGCAPRATLGHTPHYFPQPQRGCITVASSARCNPVGVDVIFLRLPRVASRTRQPWAGSRYPVGVNQLAESRQLVTNCYQLKTVCVFITQPVTNCYQLKPPTTP